MSGIETLGLLLHAIAQGEGETVAGLSRRLDLPRASLFDLAARLERAELIERDAAGRVLPGAACGRLGFAALGLAPLYPLAEALLPALRDDTDATTSLSAVGEDGERLLMQRRAPWDIGQETVRLERAIAGSNGPAVAVLRLNLRPRAEAAERSSAAACLDRVALRFEAALEGG